MSQREPKSIPKGKEYRREAYKQLSITLDQVYEHESLYLDADAVYNYCIEVGDEIDINSSDATDSGPRFCQPFAASHLEELYQKLDPELNPGLDPELNPELNPDSFPGLCYEGDAYDIAYYFQNLMGVRELPWTLAVATSWSQTSNTTRQLTLLNESFPRWVMPRIFQNTDPSTPHLACTLYDSSETRPDDRLLRAEIICATNLMKQGMRLDKKAQFNVVPVFVYSFSSRYARVVQAHFDDNKLLVRKTKWLYFPHDRDVTREVQLYLRWMMNKPTDSTRS